MTGMRAFTVGLGLVEETPPRGDPEEAARGAVGAGAAERRRARDRARPLGLRRRRRCALRGAARAVRRRPGPAPVYGCGVWLGLRAGHRAGARAQAGQARCAPPSGGARRRPRALRLRAVGVRAQRRRARRSGHDARSPAPRRARVEGTVQGVGFRPYVYRLARELGLAGWVLNDERGVLLEVEGERGAVERFLARARRRGAAAAPRRRGRPEDARADRRASGFAILASEREGEPGRAGRAGHRDVRRLPRRAVRPGRPPLPLPVRQLHELRAALHDRARRPLRPAADDDGRLRDVPRCRAEYEDPARPPLPRAAQRVPGLRPAAAADRRAGARCCRRRARCVAAAARAARGRDRRGQGARRLPPRLPRRRRAAVAALRRASTARTGRSR